MFIRTKDSLVNMFDKSVDIFEPDELVGETKHSVKVRGPIAGISLELQADIRDTYVLFRGAEDDCWVFMDELEEYLTDPDRRVIDISEFWIVQHSPIYNDDDFDFEDIESSAIVYPKGFDPETEPAF